MQTQKVIEHIVNWMSNYAQKAKTNGFVLGVSGGVDSAVVSVLAARTGMDTLLLEMPIHQASAEVSRAQKHITELKNQFPNVADIRVDLTPVFDSFQNQTTDESYSRELRELALANTRARLRMTTLYYYAQTNGLLVAGTGNKVEDFGVGFFTKYGDGGVDISPIADLLKTQVYALAKELNIVPSIQNAAPTDGLFANSKTDEEQIGASYPELEWAMSVADTHGPEDFEGRKKQVLEIYKSRHRANLHKMVPIPVCEIPDELLQCTQ